MRSASVTPWRLNGAGRVGTGWEGEARSPGTSLAGTGRSSTGQSGLPGGRANPNTKTALGGAGGARGGAGVEADDRFREEVVALPRAAVIVVPRRAHREEDEAAHGVHGERRPDVGVADPGPGAVPPGRVAGPARLRNRAPPPDPPAGPRVERLDVARRIAPVGEPVGGAVAEDRSEGHTSEL